MRWLFDKVCRYIESQVHSQYSHRIKIMIVNVLTQMMEKTDNQLDIYLVSDVEHALFHRKPKYTPSSFLFE